MCSRGYKISHLPASAPSFSKTEQGGPTLDLHFPICEAISQLVSLKLEISVNYDVPKYRFYDPHSLISGERPSLNTSRRGSRLTECGGSEDPAAGRARGSRTPAPGSGEPRGTPAEGTGGS